MNFRTNLLTAAAAAFTLMFAGTAHAQDIGGEVVRNPDDTVTYAIDVNGPPNSLSVLFVSPFQGPPIQTPFGPLYLDPVFLFDLGPVPVGPFGLGQLDFTLPPGVSENLPLHFQCVHLTQQEIVTSNDSLTLLHDDEMGAAGGGAGQPCNDWYAAGRGFFGANFRIGGMPGKTYMVQIIKPNGVVMNHPPVVVGPGGTTPLVNFMPPIPPGTQFQIWKDVGGGMFVLRWAGAL